MRPLLILLAVGGCTHRVNEGAARTVLSVDSFEIAPNYADYQFGNGTMRVRRDLSADVAFGSGMHEMVHAIEDAPYLTPRQILRLYHSAAWPVASQDLLGD